MKFTDNIELSDWNGQCLLTVRDAELHDFLDDFFTGHDLEFQVVLPSDDPGQYQLLFSPTVSMAIVQRLLATVVPNELDCK